jgi:serine/threonine-protein kinase RsbW
LPKAQQVNEQQELALSADPSQLGLARGFVDAAAAAAGFAEEERYQIMVAANEAVSNALEHGSPCPDGRIHLGVDMEGQEFVFYVRDCGEFGLGPEPDPDEIAERGRGFAFMNLLMDDVSLHTHEQTEVRLSKRLWRR